MYKNATSVLIKLFVASLLVGIAMSIFDITPESLLQDFGGTAVRIFSVIVEAIEWSIPYVLIGAVVVIPIWVLAMALRFFRNR